MEISGCFNSSMELSNAVIAGMRFCTAMSLTVVLAAPACAKAASSHTRMNAASQSILEGRADSDSRLRPNVRSLLFTIGVGSVPNGRTNGTSRTGARSSGSAQWSMKNRSTAASPSKRLPIISAPFTTIRCRLSGKTVNASGKRRQS